MYITLLAAMMQARVMKTRVVKTGLATGRTYTGTSDTNCSDTNCGDTGKRLLYDITEHAKTVAPSGGRVKNERTISCYC